MGFVKVMVAGKETQVRVCDYCRTSCIPHGHYCSGRCYRAHKELIRDTAESLARAAAKAIEAGK